MSKIPKFSFTDTQKRSLAVFPKRLIYVGVLFATAGVIRLILALGSASSGGWRTPAFVFLLVGAIDILLGMTLWRPSDNFMKVVNIDSCGIDQLMTGMEELSAGFRIAQYLAFVAGLLVLIDFVSGIL
jgi:uncharacterized membrane protein HdeD (DUF308 family)